MKKLLFVLLATFALTACDDIETTRDKSGVKETAAQQRRDSRGKLTGDEGFTFGRSEDKANASPLGVNTYLWRATLDTLSFMPLASADPFGGVIITDWYEDPQTPGERFKVNALILDKTLRADGVKITLFKQAKDNKSGNWRDSAVDGKLARSLEDTILTRARQIKVGASK